RTIEREEMVVEREHVGRNIVLPAYHLCKIHRRSQQLLVLPEQLFGLLTFSHILDDRMEQRPPVPYYRGTENFNIPNLAVLLLVPEGKNLTCVYYRVCHGPVGHFRICDIDIRE